MAANKRQGGFFTVLLFIVYLSCLAYFLFFADSMGRTIDTGYHSNLVLFQEIKRFIYHADILGWKAVLVNLGGNIVAFMPFGYFLPRLSKTKCGVIKTVLVSFLFSGAVELVQYFTKTGSFDVDDLFLNTIGGLLGFVTYCIIHRRHTKNKDK